MKVYVIPNEDGEVLVFATYELALAYFRAEFAEAGVAWSGKLEPLDIQECEVIDDLSTVGFHLLVRR